MSSLVGTTQQSGTAPYAVYNGPRVGNVFGMGQWGLPQTAARPDGMGQTAMAPRLPAASYGMPQSAALPEGMGQTAMAPRLPAASYGMPQTAALPEGMGYWSLGQAQYGMPQAAAYPSDPNVLSVAQSAANLSGAFGQVTILPSSGMGQALPALLNAASGLANEAVQSVEIRTQLTPPIVIDRPFAANRSVQQAQGNPVSAALRKILKPAIYVKTPGGVLPVEPDGPPADYSTAFAIGLGVATGLTLWAGAKIGQKLLCK